MEEVIDDFIGKFWTNDRVVDLRQLAEEQGWEFTPRQRFAEQPTAIKGFRLFKGKKGKRIVGIASFDEERPRCAVRLYDYVYYSEGGKKKTSVVEVHCPELAMSKFRIFPRRSIRSLFIRKSKLKTRSVEYFDDRYKIEASDPEITQMQLPNSALAVVTSQEKISVEGEGSYCIFYFRSKQLQSHDLLRALDNALQLVEILLFDKEKEFV